MFLGGYEVFSAMYPENCTASLPAPIRPIVVEREEIGSPSLSSPEMSRPTQILPNLFLGDSQAAANAELLASCNITFILNMAEECPNHFEADPSIKYKKIGLKDNTEENIRDHLSPAFDFIDEARSRGAAVLVHCLAGKSRSVSIVLAYLMRQKEWSLKQAYEFVKDKRPGVSPNFGFMGQLSFLSESLTSPDAEDRPYKRVYPDVTTPCEVKP